MPELAEVEYFRKQWNPGVGQPVQAVLIHSTNKVFRGSDQEALVRVLTGAKLLDSEARGKQMLFRFARGGWLGVHLGMTGALRTEPSGFVPDRHDHLALVQKRQVLVYRDPRMFGRLRFHEGTEAPSWWTALPPALHAPEFTLAFLTTVLARRRRAPLKAVLLAQEFFPGVGNWMADEILWQARLAPHAMGENLTPAQVRRLWETTRTVAQVAMETIGVDWGDPPAHWLIHVRWKDGGLCPTHGTPLVREPVGGRTTAWCRRCQRGGVRKVRSRLGPPAPA